MRESEKPKKSRKLAREKWSGSFICKLIDEYEVRPCLWDIFYNAIASADLSAAIFVYNFYAIGDQVPVSNAISSRNFDNYRQLT